MPKSAPALLAQIEGGALDSSTPLADVLRKCVALGGRAGSERLRDWARRELDGYVGEEELPSYRIIPAPIAVDGMNLRFQFKAQQISPMQLPEFARDVIKAEASLPHRVAELESMAARGDVVKLQHSGMPDLVTYLNSRADYGTAFHAMYWMVSAATVAGVLDTIRTTLVSLVAEMRAVGVEEIPTAEAADQAVNVVLHKAKRSTITVNTNQSSGTQGGSQSVLPPSAPDRQSKIPAWIRGPWGFAIGTSTIIAGVAAWIEWSPFG